LKHTYSDSVIWGKPMSRLANLPVSVSLDIQQNNIQFEDPQSINHAAATGEANVEGTF
jgi:hypothetical protein